MPLHSPYRKLIFKAMTSWSAPCKTAKAGHATASKTGRKQSVFCWCTQGREAGTWFGATDCGRCEVEWASCHWLGSVSDSRSNTYPLVIWHSSINHTWPEYPLPLSVRPTPHPAYSGLLVHDDHFKRFICPLKTSQSAKVASLVHRHSLFPSTTSNSTAEYLHRSLSHVNIATFTGLLSYWPT